MCEGGTQSVAEYHDGNMCKYVLISFLFFSQVIIKTSNAAKGGGRRAIFRSSGIQNQNKHYGFYESKNIDRDYDCKI